MNRVAIIFLAPDEEGKHLKSRRLIIVDDDGIDVINRPIISITSFYPSISYINEYVYKIATTASSYDVNYIYKIDCAKVNREGIDYIIQEISEYI